VLSAAYDPLGRLRSTTASGATMHFTYEGDRLSAEYNNVGTLMRDSAAFATGASHHAIVLAAHRRPSCSNAGRYER